MDQDGTHFRSFICFIRDKYISAAIDYASWCNYAYTDGVSWSVLMVITVCALNEIVCITPNIIRKSGPGWNSDMSLWLRKWILSRLKYYAFQYNSKYVDGVSWSILMVIAVCALIEIRLCYVSIVFGKVVQDGTRIRSFFRLVVTNMSTANANAFQYNYRWSISE